MAMWIVCVHWWNGSFAHVLFVSKCPVEICSAHRGEHERTITFCPFFFRSLCKMNVIHNIKYECYCRIRNFMFWCSETFSNKNKKKASVQSRYSIMFRFILIANSWNDFHFRTSFSSTYTYSMPSHRRSNIKCEFTFILKKKKTIDLTSFQEIANERKWHFPWVRLPMLYVICVDLLHYFKIKMTKEKVTNHQSVLSVLFSFSSSSSSSIHAVLRPSFSHSLESFTVLYISFVWYRYKRSENVGSFISFVDLYFEIEKWKWLRITQGEKTTNKRKMN